MKAARRVVLEATGWILFLGGLAALILPGPGLLLVAAGLVILSQQYSWAERRVDPIMDRALIAAAEGVGSTLKVVMSTLFALGVVACGALWMIKPDVPAWWPLSDDWWLPGGMVAGITQVLSGLMALGLIVWSYRRYHDDPEAVAELKSRARRRAERLENTEADAST